MKGSFLSYMVAQLNQGKDVYSTQDQRQLWAYAYRAKIKKVKIEGFIAVHPKTKEVLTINRIRRKA